MAIESPAETLSAATHRPLIEFVLPRALRQSMLARVAAGCMALWVLIAIGAPLIAPYNPLEQHIDDRLAPPNGTYWFGTDALGRDVLSRVIYGARISIPVGITAVALALTLGCVVGIVSGFFSGVVDYVIMRLTDLMLAFPPVILALVITAALGAGIRNAMLAITVAWWPTYARLSRGLVLAEREREYVTVARAIGVSSPRLAVRHILPNIVSPIIVMSTIDIASGILTFASLSFLGLGVPPDKAEWGAMVAQGRSNFDQWWIGTFPGLAILTVVLSINIIGDGLRDALDPRYRSL